MQKIKKMLIIFLIFNIIISCSVFASNDLKENISYEPDVLSKHCICIERTTGNVLFEKDAYSKCAMASTTKILTGLLVIENCDLKEKVEISKRAANIGGSTLGVMEGQKLSVETLLYGLLLRSGNDTAIALAEHVSGSVEAFAILMNEKAKKIGLKNSHFVTPHGLDDSEHYTTAYDLAVLSNVALGNETFRRIVGTKQINLMVGKYNRSLNNTNELLGNVEGVYGIKTGFTGMAGRCLVTACKRDDLDVIIVVLGADTKNIRGSDTKKIINYIFENFKMVDLKKEIEELFSDFKNNEKIKTIKTLGQIQLDYKKMEKYICPIDKNKISKLRTTIYCFNQIEAPIKPDTVIGKMRVICENQILFENDIFLNLPLYRINPIEYFEIFVKKYITFYSI